MLLDLTVKVIPVKVLTEQVRKPSGWVGRLFMPWLFTAVNADLNAFVKEMLELDTNEQVLEVGFGSGRLLAELAESVTDGCVEGVDFSVTMYRRATTLNRRAIKAGKVKLHQCDCDSLPFAANSFDKICSINTLCFWEKPEQCLQEMQRVLKPNGKIVIGFRDHAAAGQKAHCSEEFSFYSQTEVVNLLLAAGFVNVYAASKDGSPLTSHCAIASKAQD